MVLSIENSDILLSSFKHIVCGHAKAHSPIRFHKLDFSNILIKREEQVNNPIQDVKGYLSTSDTSFVDINSYWRDDFVQMEKRE